MSIADRKGRVIRMDINLNGKMILAGAALLLVFVGIVWKLLIRKRRSSDLFEDMEGHEFEYFCADILKQKGFVDVEVTRGSGDYGIDILAEKEGVTYAIQCKRYAAHHFKPLRCSEHETGGRRSGKEIFDGRNAGA